jgi:two-component system sensor histidine kinase YesM
MRKFGKLNHHSIQGKIFFVCLIIALCTILISLLISYYAEADTIKNTATSYMKQYLTYADNSLGEMINDAKKVSLAIAVEREIVHATILDPSPEASYDWYQKKKKVESYLSGLMANKSYIQSIAIVTEDQQIYQAGYDFLLKRDLKQDWIIDAMKQSRLQTFYNLKDEPGIILCRTMQYGKHYVSMNIIEMDYEILIGAYDAEPLQSVQVFIYTPDQKMFLSNIDHKKSQTNIDAVQKLAAGENDTGYIHFGGEKQFFIRYTSNVSSLTTVSMIPYRILFRDATDLKYKFMLIGVFAILLALTASLILSSRICKGIQILTKNMEDIKEGNLDARAQIMSQDEVGKLADTFNNMMAQIKALMQEVKTKEKLKREAEQSVLAAQIQPHFLYNTLNSIQYMAHMKEESEIENVTNALAELLRSVLGNKDEFITFWEERLYIENYMTIQRFKYRNNFSLIWDVDDELWSFPIPKLLLQPIVENALLHGIADMEHGGVINVKIYSQDDEIIFKITDNGKGMKKEVINKLLSDTQKQDDLRFRRVGITNVFGRIGLIYGKQYGGTIYSYPDMFTCVELRIPRVKKEEDAI